LSGAVEVDEQASAETQPVRDATDLRGPSAEDPSSPNARAIRAAQGELASALRQLNRLAS
jgi:hypothetical protein